MNKSSIASGCHAVAISENQQSRFYKAKVYNENNPKCSHTKASKITRNSIFYASYNDNFNVRPFIKL